MSAIYVSVEVQVLLAIAEAYCTNNVKVNQDSLLTINKLRETFNDESEVVTPLIVSLAIARVNLLQKYLETDSASEPLRQSFAILVSGLERLRAVLDKGAHCGPWSNCPKV